MAHFSLCVLKTHELVWLLDLTSQLESPLLAKHAQIEHQSIVLEDKAGELEAANETIRVRVTHVFVGHNYIVLSGHVIGQIVIHDESQQAIQKRGIHLLIHFVHLSLNQNCGSVFSGVPHISQVVQTLAPFVHQQGRRLLVSRLHPVGEQVALVSLIPQILVQVGVCDFLQWLDIIDWNDMRVEIHELDSHLFERSVAE